MSVNRTLSIQSIILLAVSGLTTVLPALAQNTSPQVVTGKPFVGNATLVKAPPVADSNGSSQTVSLTYYRDSEGRTRIEESSNRTSAWSGTTPNRVIKIIDPVAGVAFRLYPSTNTAVKSVLRWDFPTQPSARPTIASAQITMNTLGVQTFLGLACTGTVTLLSSSAPSGGSDKLTTISTKQWYSGELQIVLKNEIADPTRGTVRFEFQSLTQASPDASLFTPPSTFTVIEAQSDQAVGRTF